MKTYHLTTLMLCLLFLGINLPAQHVYSQDNPHLYSTGTAMEPDRCASAWLIKRFVDIEAQFKFFPDGSLVPEGIPFDTPDATLCRTHHLSTFEIIVQKYRIDDPGIDKLAQAIHSIEIDYWGGERSDLALEIEQALRNIIVQSENNHQCLEKCFQFLDQLLIRIKE